MAAIEIEPNTLEQMSNHAKRAYPDECCGALFGSEHGGTRTIHGIMEIENTSDADRQRRFSIAPGDYLRAEQKAEELKLHLLGFYHSHPDHPAYPSQTDREFAQVGFSYPIMTITADGVTEITSWRLADRDSWYLKEDLRIMANARIISRGT